MENAIELLAALLTFVSCGRCNGAGKITAYSGVLGGVCFDCNGKARRRAYHVHASPAYPLPAHVEENLERLGFAAGYEIKKLYGTKYKTIGYFADCGHGQWASYNKANGFKIYGAANVREAAAFSGFVEISAVALAA